RNMKLSGTSPSDISNGTLEGISQLATVVIEAVLPGAAIHCVSQCTDKRCTVSYTVQQSRKASCRRCFPSAPEAITISSHCSQLPFIGHHLLTSLEAHARTSIFSSRSDYLL